MKRALPRIWLITDRLQTRGDLVELLASTLGGVPAGLAGIILREKDLEGGALLSLARRIRKACPDAPLVINGRVDIALACEADGVHLGGNAPLFEDVLRMSGELLVGVSLHGAEQAPAGADYALLSPVFETTSKPGAAPLGLAAFAGASTVPLFALGGIDAGNATACLNAGAFGIAVRGAVLLAAEPRRELQKLAAALGFPNAAAG